MTRSVKVFVVYARADGDLKERLLKHLEPLRLQGLISTWHDADIDGGVDWESAIQASMADSQLILLLVSPDFMGSAYIQSKELAEALRRDEQGTARVVPVFLRPAYWEVANFAHLQGLPRNGQAVESSSSRTVDEALLEVVRGIAKVIEGVGQPAPPAPTADDLESEETAPPPTQAASTAAVSAGRQSTGLAAAEETEQDFDEKFRKGRPFLRLAAFPETLNSDAIDIESNDVRSTLLNPPALRAGGWNMNLRASSVSHWRDGIEIDGRDARLRLSTSGLMEFTQPLERAFRRREEEDGFIAGPRLYPYPVVEYPLSFVTLYRSVAEDAHLAGPFTFEMQYWDLNGWFLPPNLPKQVGFIFADQLTPYPEQHFRTSSTVTSRDFDPGDVTATLLRPFYRSFGHGAEAIPTYDSQSRRVTFDLAKQ